MRVRGLVQAAARLRAALQQLNASTPDLFARLAQTVINLPALRSALDTIPTLASLARLRSTLQPLLDAQHASLPAEPNEHDEHTLRLLLAALDQGSRCAAERKVPAI